MASPDIDAVLAANTTEMGELRAALARAQRAARRKQLATDELVAAVYSAAKDAMLAHGPAPKIEAPAKDRRSAKPEVALLHLTDWQVGKRTRSYDMAIAADRVRQSVQRTAELADIQRSHHPVRECHVMLGGDMVEGVSIFPGQAFEVEAAGFEQMVATAGLIESAVRSLLEQFESVTVWEEIGNHGRLGRKGDMPHGDNVDRMAYTLARTRVADKRLTWHAWGGGLGTHVCIGDYTALLVHGDEIKSFGGNTPAFGILRKCNAWATGVVDPFIDVYMGHFHHAMALTMANGGRVFVTGSPESDNEYAREFVAATSQPSQRLHFVDPARGRVTAEYLLWLS
ncbi:hypothetical protein EBZ38_15265 [bacterium]|nr:hypothetical protein [bacterium]